MSQCCDASPIEGAAQPASILDKKEFVRLQDDEVQIIGNKCACSSVWCQKCYVLKGGSNRLSHRLIRMNFRSVRQVVLTVDLKKFEGSGRVAYEYLREKKAIAQFIHDLKRTGNVLVKDWAWVLEWHTDGAPHWHLFIETVKGKSGKIGNETLLRHWDHGLVFESYIKSESHWKRFTDYFAGSGYFNPRHRTEAKDKQHQLELPDWAKKVNYRIRKTGSMVQKENDEEQKKVKPDQLNEEYVEERKDQQPRTYEEILKSCGETTQCRIYYRIGDKLGRIWRKIKIPYRCFKELPGEYIQNTGYFVCMTMGDFYLFRAFYDNDLTAANVGLEGE